MFRLKAKRLWAMWWNPRRLWVKYVLAATLVACVLIGSQITADMEEERAAADAQIINMSGRQRMLSQRILHLAQTHTTAPTAETAARLRGAIETMSTTHAWLLDVSRESEAARHLYFGPGRLDARTRAYLADARKTLLSGDAGAEAKAALIRLRRVAEANILRDLDAAVAIFEAEAQRNHATLEAIREAALITAMLVLILEGLLIFWPAQRSVNRAFDDLAERNRALDLAREEVLAQNDELLALTDRLDHSAHHDPLTGLANRKRLYDELTAMIDMARSTGAKICVMHIDLDRFKEVNDTLGHPVGDAVLRQVAAAMRTRMRATDVIARVGGDEFVIAATYRRDDDMDRPMGIAADLIRRIRAPIRVGDVDARVGASVGVVLTAPDDRDAGDLMADADIALYEAKRGGRGVARAFTQEMRDGLEIRRSMTADLEDAVAAEAFEPFFQPQVSLDDGRIVGFEALARWRHPRLGLLTPGAFIELAEETRVVDALDAIVTRKAIAALAALRADGWTAPRMAVNASARSMRDPNFAQSLSDLVDQHGLEPADVAVEVVETTLIEDAADRAAQTICALAKRGFFIEIDDFGTGYASLANLARLEIHGLKIDRSLVAEAADRRSAQVIQSIVALADGMGLSVIAEGVETPAQFAAMKRMKCGVAQGFGVGRPMPAEELSDWLEAYGRAGAVSIS